jgi:flagellar hook-associated protein 1 FlgK
MISPGFFGLFNAHRSLLVAQGAMNVINQNISNANTDGYSRQTATITTADPYAAPSISQLAQGQLGQGPLITQITRSRDQYIDAQYRQANGFLGQNNNVSSILNQIQGVLAEPSTNGANTAMQNFFDAAQELSVNPDSTAVRSAFMQQGADMVTTFQQEGQQLLDMRKNLVGDPLDPNSFSTSQLAISATQVNTKLAAIVKLNQNITSIQSSGAQPNDLLDQRDKLLDDLSSYADIKVTNFDNGQVDVSIAGQMMIHGVTQLDSLQVVQNTGTTPTPDDVPALLKTVNGGVVLNDGTAPDLGSGSLKGISDMGGNDPSLTTVRGALGKLDTLLNTIVTQVNSLQTTGRDLNGNLGTSNPVFTTDPTLNPGQPLSLFHVAINKDIVNDPSLLAAASDDSTATGGFAGVGDGRNATALAKLRDTSFSALGSNVVDYLSGLISKLGTDANSYSSSATSQKALVASIAQQRESVSGVNVDEETIDLLRFQRAFEGSSKVISTLDEMYKTIINMVS